MVDRTNWITQTKWATCITQSKSLPRSKRTTQPKRTQRSHSDWRNYSKRRSQGEQDSRGDNETVSMVWDSPIDQWNGVEYLLCDLQMRLSEGRLFKQRTYVAQICDSEQVKPFSGLPLSGLTFKKRKKKKVAVICSAAVTLIASVSAKRSRFM